MKFVAIIFYFVNLWQVKLCTVFQQIFIILWPFCSYKHQCIEVFTEMFCTFKWVFEVLKWSLEGWSNGWVKKVYLFVEHPKKSATNPTQTTSTKILVWPIFKLCVILDLILIHSLDQPDVRSTVFLEPEHLENSNYLLKLLIVQI